MNKRFVSTVAVATTFGLMTASVPTEAHIGSISFHEGQSPTAIFAHEFPTSKEAQEATVAVCVKIVNGSQALQARYRADINSRGAEGLCASRYKDRVNGTLFFTLGITVDSDKTNSEGGTSFVRDGMLADLDKACPVCKTKISLTSCNTVPDFMGQVKNKSTLAFLADSADKACEKNPEKQRVEIHRYNSSTQQFDVIPLEQFKFNPPISR